MSLVGYARVSSESQSVETQIQKLEAISCDKIFTEKCSATIKYAKNSSKFNDPLKFKKRTELDACLEYLREGDILVITKLDRLARSILHLFKIVEVLERKQVALQVLDQQIDTSTSTGRLLFSMLGVIAQFEADLIKERQQEGIKKAKSKGVHFGRQKELNLEQMYILMKQREHGVTIKKLCRKYDLSPGSIYRYLAEARKYYEENPLKETSLSDKYKEEFIQTDSLHF